MSRIGGRRTPVVLAALVSLLCAACGGSAGTAAGTATPTAPDRFTAGNPSTPVTISFWSYNYGTAGLGGKAVQDLIDGFQRRYPNIHIDAKGVNNVQMNAQVQAASAAGQPPDIAQVALSSVGYVAAALPYTPIDSFASQQEYDAQVNAFVPAARPLGMYEGKRVAMPFNFSTPTMFYNASLFRRAGLDPSHPPTTWDEVRKDALQINKATGAGGVYVANSGSFDWMTQSIINSGGGYTVKPRSGGVDVGFDQKPAVQALQMLQDLNKSGAMPNYGSTGSAGNAPDLEAFATGNLGMYLQSTIALPQLVKVSAGKFEVMTAAEPAFGTKPVRPVNSGAGLIAFSKERAKLAADWTFIRYLTGHDGVEIVAKEMGYLPFRTDVANDPTVLETTPLLKPTLAQLPQMTTWVPWPGRGSAQAMTVFQNAVQAVEFGGAPASSTMSEAAGRVRGMLKP